MGDLFPVIDVPGELDVDTGTEQQYNPAPLFDVESGDFVLNGAGQPLYGTGFEAWILWCTKAITTERWAHLAYSDNTGIEAEEAFKEPDREARESAFERTITETLLADPMGRAQEVSNFEFAWNGDSLCISCEITGVDGNSATINADLKM